MRAGIYASRHRSNASARGKSTVPTSRAPPGGRHRIGPAFLARLAQEVGLADFLCAAGEHSLTSARPAPNATVREASGRA
ncbi:hypothetical protein GCM10018790_68790 [Kitasatospora xanthocidica]|nr:hypothetical protein GCM10018790_68790 [Kitasatospora xanthocidica]